MSANKYLMALATTAALTLGQSAVAQEPAGDSAYQWGRWAVLSPAAGGEPFRAPDEPGADFNVRPGELFGPEVLSSNTPPVADDPRDRLPPRPTLPPPGATDPRDRLPPRPTP